MRTRFVAAALFAASLCGISLPSARATLVQRMEVEDLTRASDLVAIAVVERVASGWDANGSIRTRATMRIERVLSGGGAVPRTVEVTSFGGEVDGTSMDFPGNPRFETGERVVVFLAPWEKRPGERQVVGAFQGAFRLAVEPETSMPLAVRRSAPGAAVVGGDPAEGGDLVLYLDELEARVRSAGGAK